MFVFKFLSFASLTFEVYIYKIVYKHWKTIHVYMHLNQQTCLCYNLLKDTSEIKRVSKFIPTEEYDCLLNILEY